MQDRRNIQIPIKSKRLNIHKNRKPKKFDKVRETSMRLMFIFAKRFIAGETLEEALNVIEKVKGDGFFTTSDVLGEAVTRIKDAKDASDEYRKLLLALKNRGLEMNISLKPTQLGLDISEQTCFENVCKVLNKASETDAFVRIDMEGSAHTDIILQLVHRWHEGYHNLGTVIQAMLKRSPKDVEDLIKSGIRIRLCKGAYKEPADIAFKDKKDVDMQYIEIATRLLNSGLYHGIATHDEKIIEHVKEYALRHHIAKDSFEFQMLYGIRRDIQEALKRDGWCVRVYVPYGKHWFKYTLRRMRERKENIWFVAKNLLRK